MTTDASFQPYVDLARAVLMLAVDDAIEGDGEARDWLSTDDAAFWAAVAGFSGECAEGGDLPELMTTDDLMALSGLARVTVNRRIREGVVPAIKRRDGAHERWYVLADAARAWAETIKQPSKIGAMT